MTNLQLRVVKNRQQVQILLKRQLLLKWPCDRLSFWKNGKLEKEERDEPEAKVGSIQRDWHREVVAPH